MAKKPVIALSIEHGYIKLLVTSGRDVVHYRAVLASPQFFHEGLVRDTARVGAMVKNMLNELGVTGRQAIGVAPGFQASLRLLEFPKARGFDAEVVIPRTASRTMGVSQEHSALTWRETRGTADRRRWMVMAAARRAVSGFVETAHAAELTVAVMDMRPFALARAVNQPNAYIAWVAPDGCDVVVVRDSIPVSYQSLFWGAEPVEGVVLVYRLTEIIERTAAGYDQASTEGPMPTETPLYVCGSPIGVDPSIASQVAESLQRTAGVLAPPVTAPEDFPIQDFVVNVGLALREL